MKISIVVTWPNHMDYPLWRKQLRRYRSEFDQVIVSLSNNHETPDITEYLRQVLAEDNVIVIDPPEIKSGEDWRDKTIKKAWQYITGDWILFTEQDFFFTEAFICVVKAQMVNHDFIVMKDNERLHPAFLLVKKELADKTERYFGTVPDKADHFFVFTEELRVNATHWTSLDQICLYPKLDYLHMTGLTHNYSRYCGGLVPTGKNDFLRYNHYTSQIVLKDHPLYDRIIGILNAHEHGTDNEEVDKFFNQYI